MRKSFNYVIILIGIMTLLTSCEQEIINPTPSIPELEFNSQLPMPSYNPIITNGCDPNNDVIDLMEFPYIDSFPGENIDNSFWSSLSNLILNNAANNILNTFNSPILDKIKSFFFGKDETAEKLNQVLSNLNEINKKMDVLLEVANKTLQKVDEIQYNQMHDGYVKFNNHLSVISALNDEFASKLKENMTDEEAVALVKEWGTRVVNGNSAPYVISSIVTEMSDFNYLYNGKNRNLFAVYDMIVFHNTPWENHGYDLRDMFRAASAAEITRTMYMTALYYTVNKSEYSLKKLQECAKWLSDFYSSKGNSVTRRTDRLVCQLEGAHFVLDADALHEKKSWTGTCWMNSDQTVFAEGNLTGSPDVSQVKNSQLKNAEINVIAQYYMGKGKGKEYTLLKCLQDGGLKVNDKYLEKEDSIPELFKKFNHIFLASQDTGVETYQYYEYMELGNVLNLTMHDFYCVGIPLSDHVFSNGYGMLDGHRPGNFMFYSRNCSDIDGGGTKTEKQMGFHMAICYSQWRLKGNNVTYPVPGRAFLIMKPGSLKRYKDYDDTL